MIKSMKKSIACGALAIVALILPFCGSEPDHRPAYRGLFPITQGGKSGYIDKTGKVVISPQFDRAREFFEGLATAKFGGKWGYIDKSGKYVINPQFDWAEEFSEGLAPVEIGGKWGW